MSSATLTLLNKVISKLERSLEINDLEIILKCHGGKEKAEEELASLKGARDQLEEAEKATMTI